MISRRSILSATLAAALVACGGGTEPGVNTSVVVTSITVSPATAQVEVGATTALTADIRDQKGAVVTGKTLAWTSSVPSVAIVNPTSGSVTGVTAGTAQVSATVDGKTGQATVTVLPVPVASITIGSVPALAIGAKAMLLVVVKDSKGNVLTGRRVAYSTSTTSVATVDSLGVVTTVSAGTATITALSEGVSATTAIVVSPPAGTALPTITSIAPATLTPGATVTITGTNFISGTANNTVKVAGVAATVSAASPTSLTVTLPATGLPCQSTQPVNVEVTTVGGTAVGRQSLQVATTRTLAVGASFMASGNGNVSCNELPATGQYMISVFNAGTARGDSAGFELKGAAGGVTAASQGLAPVDVARSVTVLAPARAPRRAVTATEASVAQKHLDHLASDLALVRTLGSPSRYGRHTRAAGVAASSGSLAPGTANFSLSPVPLTVGATTTINFHFNSCTIASASTITARVVYVGPKTVVLEDNAGPLAGTIDASMIQLAQEFETISYPALLNFGDPLAFDSETDNNGRIIMMFTPKVNEQSANLLGFVSSCDLYPPSIATSVGASNQAEIFYARAVTDSSSTATSLNARGGWRRQMPSTLIHETKHIIAFAERFATPIEVTSFEQTWLEEATAQLASEFYGRAIHGNGWRTNSSYVGTLDCEVRPSFQNCNGGIFVMGNHFGFLSDFLQNVETKTILSGTDDNDIYGSSWMFARWLVDTYGGANEGSFIRSIVLNYNVTGTANVAAVSGKSWPELLAQFSLMLATDDLANVTPPFTEQSWNLPGVFAGYNADFPSSRPAAPLALRVSPYGAFTASVPSLKGGGFMLMKLLGTPTAPTQILDLHGPAGAALPAGSKIGVAVVRIQ